MPEDSFEQPVFRCEDRDHTGMLGSFDGRDSRQLMVFATERPAQLLVSIHEQLHHELQWSTAWGLIAAMAGLLAEAGVDEQALGPLARKANGACWQVHEVFATTISSGAVGVPQARRLMAGNDLYLGYLDEGLGLGGPAEAASWQFRESAMQMLLRSLMQPAALADLVSRGFTGLRPLDLEPESIQPDVRLEAVASGAGTWWADTFAAVLAEHPGRGGDSGGTWQRDLPDDQAAMDALKSWEETVLIPALQETADARMRAAGFAVLGPDEYLEVTVALRDSFLELAPPEWEVEVLAGPRRLRDEPLGGEREAVVLHPERARLLIRDADDLATKPDEFLHPGEDGPRIISLYLRSDIIRRQFEGADQLLAPMALLGIAGIPRASAAERAVPIALMRPGVSPHDLTGMFQSLPVTTVTTLATTLNQEARDAVLELELVLILVDLPLRLQVDSWIEGAGRVRFRVIELRGDRHLNLIVFKLDGFPQRCFLSYRSDAGVGELAQLLDRHPERLTADLAISDLELDEIRSVSTWLMNAWHRLDEIPGPSPPTS